MGECYLIESLALIINCPILDLWPKNTFLKVVVEKASNRIQPNSAFVPCGTPGTKVEAEDFTNTTAQQSLTFCPAHRQTYSWPEIHLSLKKRQQSVEHPSVPKATQNIKIIASIESQWRWSFP